MKTILCVKDGVLGNLLAIILLLSLCSFIIWWSFARDLFLLPFALVGCSIWFLLVIVFARRMWLRTTCSLWVKDGAIVWSKTDKVSRQQTEKSLLIRSVRSLEIVFYRNRWEGTVRDYGLATVYLIDVHGNRHQLPPELMPGIYYKKIFNGIQQVAPSVVLEERFEN